MNHYQRGCQVLGGDDGPLVDCVERGSLFADLLGAYDLNAWSRQMDTLKQVPVALARVLLKNGKAAIDQANVVAKGKRYKPGSALPGQTSRDNVFWKLDWHGRADGGNLLAAIDPTAIYASGGDLKKWATQAFIEANAADEGAAWINKAWSDMWDEIAQELIKLPQDVAETVRKVPAQVFEGLTGVPAWVIPVGVVGITGLLAYGIYKIAMVTVPAVGAVAAQKYLPGGR